MALSIGLKKGIATISQDITPGPLGNGLRDEIWKPDDQVPGLVHGQRVPDGRIQWQQQRLYYERVVYPLPVSMKK